MQNPKETVRLDFTVTKEQAAKIRRFVANLRYQEDEKDSKAYGLILNNPKVPLKSIQYMLSRDFGISKRVSKLKRIAEECGLPFTE